MPQTPRKTSSFCECSYLYLVGIGTDGTALEKTETENCLTESALHWHRRLEMCVVSGGAVAFYTAAHAQRREQSRRRRRRWRRRRHLRLRLRRRGQRQRHCNGIRSSQLFARYVAEPLSFTLSGLFPP